MRAFIEAIANHPELQNKIMAADNIQDLLKIAASAGYNMTIKELETTLTEDFGELVLELENNPGISAGYAGILLTQLIESICFSS
ncbi:MULTISPECIES: Nif11-like leader peptide family natural product precursor [Arthrospira]|uniref:Nif11 domain-containing protein n=1 Tax=Limnospira platensis NIES-46 TaxID=1236695 RepID=A0A5M3SZ29_LIMPL|nr:MULTISPECIES: Nif11-like leader peptide family natural product precursor [Arthrospira]AMW27442.1 hypothetical protein AP285_05040 [Arthrospira platensis YZ]KDR58067.1 hypothetical protein APPUASWS_007285 [Arthrospira platensis str. Paraca]MBD2668022.1 Nif11-like leader peptide family natural product precursor [Arthrospira platensis FACHB-439]MBD2709961.1 Nif11-like leader peptide family natural product precursor [Arthrospira platensis FACHB-835]MDF2210984.1 Nif11-like leader peptide family 